MADYSGMTDAEVAAQIGTPVVDAEGRVPTGLDVTGDDIIIDDDSRGVVLKDSDDVYWRIQVTTLGVLTVTSLGATKPTPA